MGGRGVEEKLKQAREDEIEGSSIAEVIEIGSVLYWGCRVMMRSKNAWSQAGCVRRLEPLSIRS